MDNTVHVALEGETTTGGRPQKPVLYVIDENGCHVCISHVPKGKKKVPKIIRDRQESAIIRYLYELQGGIVGFDERVERTCNNKSCINIEHVKIVKKVYGED